MFSWTAVSGATYKCIFDGGAEFDCECTIVKVSCDQPMYQICHCHCAGSSGYKLSFTEAGSGAHTFMVRAFVNNQLAGSSTASFTVPGKELVHIFMISTKSCKLFLPIQNLQLRVQLSKLIFQVHTCSQVLSGLV